MHDTSKRRYGCCLSRVLSNMTLTYALGGRIDEKYFEVEGRLATASPRTARSRGDDLRLSILSNIAEEARGGGWGYGGPDRKRAKKNHKWCQKCDVKLKM